MDSHESARVELRFIKDQAADEDFFGSHRRIADAIAAAIDSNSDVKVIGLLGPWGSGKSTVVKLLQGKWTKEKAPKVETHCFFYDAWLHQSDPPRRSFLETLIHFLIPTLTTQERWQERLDQLNGQIEDTETISTPTLTTYGRLVLAALLLLPLGMQFVGHDWYDAGFGEHPLSFARWLFFAGAVVLSLPPIIALLVYWVWRPVKYPWNPGFRTLKNWTTHKHPHQDESIISIFMNREVQRTRNRVIKSPDPTAIEFQDIFREIMSAVGAPNRRFLFIIDNLDRLPEQDAVALWGTIRSFLLGASKTNSVREATNTPIVLLPIDDDAVQRMYLAVDNEDAHALAQSFMDKTFDLIFHVPPPVLSDWNNFLTQQMRYVFGSEITEEQILHTSRIYEKFVSRVQSGPVTPRKINSLVNLIGALWLQWKGTEVEFVSVAYYAIFRELIESDALDVVQNPQAGIESIDENWQQSIAAVHFGVVPVKNALQVIIERPLQAAISNADAAAFKALSDVPTFDRVFQRSLDNLSAVDGVSSGDVTNSVNLLSDLDPPSAPWVSIAWRTLRRAFERMAPWKQLTEQDVEALRAHLAHCSERDLPRFLEVATTKLGAIEGGTIGEEFPDLFANACRVLATTARSHQLQVPDIYVPTGPRAFLATLVQVSEDNDLLSHVKTRLAPTELTEPLVGGLTDAGTAPGVEPLIKALLASPIRVDWQPVVNAATDALVTQAVESTQSFAGLGCLGLLFNVTPLVGSAIQKRASEGTLHSKLAEAYSQNRCGSEARLIALMLASGVSPLIPSAFDWSDANAACPDLAEMVNSNLSRFGSKLALDDLVGLVGGDSKLLPMVKSLISNRVKRREFDAVDPERIVERLPHYIESLDSEAKPLFFAELASNNTFWSALDLLPFEGNVLAVFQELLSLGGTSTAQAADHFDKRLQSIPAEQWGRSIDSKDDLYDTISTRFTIDLSRPQLGSQLYEALSDRVGELLANADTDMRYRWFLAAWFLGLSARQTVFKNVRDQINGGASVADLPGLLVTGGATLLLDGSFAGQADQSVRHIVVPLLSIGAGIEWLTAQAEIVRSWIGKSDHATVDFVAQRICDLIGESAERQRHELEVLADAVGLKLPRNTLPAEPE